MDRAPRWAGLSNNGRAAVFLYSDTLGVPPFVSPLLLLLVMMGFLFNPTRTLRHEARFWMIRIMVTTRSLHVACMPLLCQGYVTLWFHVTSLRNLKLFSFFLWLLIFEAFRSLPCCCFCKRLDLVA